MTTPITPASPPTISTSLTGPADGEVANALSVNSVFQDLEDDAEAFRLLTYGGGIRRRVLCSSNTVLTIQPLGAVVVKSSLGVWTVFSHSAASTVSPVTITGGLVAGRWWVYGYESGGALAFTASTTAPDVGLRYMNGDEKYVYITSFYVDAGPNVMTYTQDDNFYKYLEHIAGNRVLNGVVGPAVAVTQSLAGPSPSQASSVLLRAEYAASVVDSLELLTTTTNNRMWNMETTATGTPSSAYITHSLADGNQLDYSIGAATTALTLWVSGFWM